MQKETILLVFLLHITILGPWANGPAHFFLAWAGLGRTQSSPTRKFLGRAQPTPTPRLAMLTVGSYFVLPLSLVKKNPVAYPCALDFAPIPNVRCVTTPETRTGRFIFRANPPFRTHARVKTIEGEILA